MPPYSFDYINQCVSKITPNTSHFYSNETAAYFARYLLKRAMSVFEWTLPDWWQRNYFLYTLYCWGYISVLDTAKYGIICQQCALTGYDIFYQPTGILVSNPNLTGEQRTIGKDCAIIRLQPDYSGLHDVVAYYAAKMATLARSVDVNAMNTALGYIFKAGSKQEAETIKKAYDKLTSGETLVVVDKSTNTTAELLDRDVGRSYIVSQLLADIATLENEFNTTVGINNANTQKKERLISDEVNANNQEVRALSHIIYDQLKADMETVYSVTGLTPAEFNVDWREKENERVHLSSGDIQP